MSVRELFSKDLFIYFNHNTGYTCNAAPFAQPHHHQLLFAL